VLRICHIVLRAGCHLASLQRHHWIVSMTCLQANKRTTASVRQQSTKAQLIVTMILSQRIGLIQEVLMFVRNVASLRLTLTKKAANLL